MNDTRWENVRVKTSISISSVALIFIERESQRLNLSRSAVIDLAVAKYQDSVDIEQLEVAIALEEVKAFSERLHVIEETLAGIKNLLATSNK